MRFFKTTPKGVLLLIVLGSIVFSVHSYALDLTDGIRFGSFSIHPSISTSIRYVDNIYFVPNDYQPVDQYAVPQSVESDFVLNVNPTLLFDVSVPTFTAQVGYRFYYDNYLGYDDEYNTHHELNAKNHTFSGLLDYKAPFGLLLKVQDSYTSQEAFEESDEYADFLRGKQKHNDGRALIGYAHGAENNIYAAYTYINIIDEFAKYDEYDKMAQYHQGDFRFKFLPRTAATFSGGYGMIGHDKSPELDSDLYWGLAGLQGQITTFMQLTLRGGYTSIMYDQSENGSGPIGEAELAFVFPSETKIAIGYKRKFKDSTNTNYYTSDQAYLMASKLWGSRLTTDLSGGYQYNDFSEPLSRHEDFIQAKLDITLRLVFWLYVGTGYQLEHKIYEDSQDKNQTTRNVGLIKFTAQF